MPKLLYSKTIRNIRRLLPKKKIKKNMRDFFDRRKSFNKATRAHIYRPEQVVDLSVKHQQSVNVVHALSLNSRLSFIERKPSDYPKI